MTGICKPKNCYYELKRKLNTMDLARFMQIKKYFRQEP